jgi:hypothetical protein
MPLDFSDLVPPVPSKPASFDDLVPQKSAGGMSFDDLIPQERSPSRAVNTKEPQAQAEDLPPEEPGFLSNMGQAAKSGFMQDIRNLAGLPATLQGKAQQQPDEAPQPYQQPLTLSDIAHPSQALPKITYQLASSGSTLGAGIAGGIAGEAVAPEGGGLVGGAAAAGAATALGQLTPIFAREMQKPNADPNKAWDATLAQAGQAGLFSAAGWAAFGAKFFEGPVKNLLFQAFGVQPGIGMTERGVENWEQGKPLTEGMEGTYLGSAVSTAIPLAGHAAIRGMGAKAAPVASPELRQGVADMLDETAPAADTPRTPEQAAAAEAAGAPTPPNAPPAEKELADLVTPKPPAPMGEAAPAAEAGLGAPLPAPTASDAAPARPAPSAESKSPYTMLDPDQLVLRPDLFQFKASDERGGTGALTGAKWDQTLTNPITAWQANDGTISPVNGHQRTILAQDSKAAGQPDVQVPARVFSEADGYTPDFMRVLGAYQNIAEGSGTALDFAKVLRGKSAVPDDLSLPDIAPHNALAIQARGLAALSPDAFGMVEAGAVPDAYASFVGAMIADPAEQIATMDLLAKRPPANAEQARIMVQDARNSGFLRGAQTTLFGDEDVATSLFPQRARVLDNAMKTLRRAGAVFQGNLAGKSENDRLLTQLTVDGTKRGPVSDALTAAATDLAAGKSVSGVTSRFLASVRALEQRGPDEGVQHGTEIRGNGPAGEAGAPVEDALLSRRAPLPPLTGPSLFGEPERETVPKREPEPTFRTDPRQMGLLGTEPTARQAQAARDAAGPRSGQEPANEGLFAEKGAKQSGLLARREGDAAPREIDPEAKARLQDAAQRAMRAIGLPDKVGLNLVDRIQDGTADGRYTHGLIDLALDTPHGLLPAKLFHESVHALMDPALGLLGNGERRALEIGADRWLKQGTNRADLESRGYGQNEFREEAIARMGEEALARGVNAPAPYYKMLNFLKGIGQWLRGEGLKTADDVFDSVMRGERRTGEVGAEAAPSYSRRDPELALSTEPDILRDKKGLSRAMGEVQAAFAPSSIRGAGTQEAMLRFHGATLAQSYGRAATALESVRNAIDKLPTAEQDAFTNRYETGQKQPTPELQKISDTLHQVIGQWTAKVQSLGRGYLANAIQDYMGHIYSNYPEWSRGIEATRTAEEAAQAARAAGQSKAPLQGSGAFLKQRTFPTLQDAMAAGLEPVTHNPIDMQLLKLREMQKFYHGTTLADKMKDGGLARWVSAGGERDAAEAGLVKLDDRVFQPRITGDANPAGFGRLEAGNWYAPEPVARIFNNYMSRGLAGNSIIYDTLRASNNALNSLQLGLSGFHATFIMMDAAISKVALGLQQIGAGRVGRGLANVLWGVTPGANLTAGLRAITRGAKLRNAWLDPAQATPELSRLVDDLNLGGGRINMDQFYRTTASGAFFKHLGDLKHPESVLYDAARMFRDAKGPLETAVMTPLRIAGRLIDTINEPLMGQTVPRAKLGVFSDLAQNWHDTHPNATPEQRSAAMIKFWDSVDNRMGQLVYDNLMWKKTQKDIAFIASRSVGWNLGTLREIGGSFVDSAAAMKAIASGKAPEFTTRMAYTMALPVVTATMGAMLTYLATGKGPQSL